jgi:hypothetical protein
MNFENKTDKHGQRLIWLDRAVLDRLRSLRGPGESYSDVILRLSADAPGRFAGANPTGVSAREAYPPRGTMP